MSRISRPVTFSAAALVLVAIGAGAWFTLLQPSQATSKSAIAQPGAPAPQIALPVVGNGTSNLAAEKGNVVLINFWATWCEPCKAEMPLLQQLAIELRERPFRLYSVDLQEDADQIEAFEREHSLDLYAVMDQDGEATRVYGVRALPSTFLVDQRGIVHLQHLGPLTPGGPETTWSEPWLAEQVRSLLSPGA